MKIMPLRFFVAAILAVSLMSFSLYNQIGFGGESPEQDDTDCLKKYNSKWGDRCDNCAVWKDSYKVFLKNTCPDQVDVKVAVQESNKKWRSFSWTALNPNDTMMAYACSGTGRYLWWVRKTGDNSITFPADNEINEKHKD